MRLRHLEIVERRKVSQPSRTTAPPPPLYRGGVVVVERAPTVRQGRGFRTLSSDIADQQNRLMITRRKSHPLPAFFLARRSKPAIGSYNKSRCNKMKQEKQYISLSQNDILPYNLPINGDI